MALAKWLISAIMNSVVAPRPLRTIERFPVIGDNTNPYGRLVYAEANRDLILRNPSTNTVSFQCGFTNNDNGNSNSNYNGAIVIAPGQEMYSPADTSQYYIRQAQAGSVTGQYIEIERVTTF